MPPSNNLYALLGLDKIVCGVVLLVCHLTTSNESFVEQFDHFSLAHSVIDLWILCIVRVVVHVSMLKYPLFAFPLNGIAKVKERVVSKAFSSLTIINIITATVYSNYALAKCLAVIVDDADVPKEDGNDTVSALYDDSFARILGDDDAHTFRQGQSVSNMVVFAFYLVLTVLFSYVEYKHVGNHLGRLQTKMLRLRRSLRKRIRAGSVISVVVNNSLNSPLLGSPAVNGAPVPDSDLSDDDEDYDTDEEELEDEYNNLVNQINANGNQATEGVKQRLKERMKRVRKRNRKKKREQEKKEKRSVQASVGQLLQLSRPDIWLLLGAFVCLVVAAITQAMIPMSTSKILNIFDSKHDNEPNKHGRFMATLNQLILASIVCGIFSGLRGAIFTACTARLTIRVRKRLFHSLLNQEVGYFDKTNIGEITSRLNSDTTKMSDQISLNINVLLRSMVEGTIYLFAMFYVNPRLAMLSFILIPLMTVISNFYSTYYRKLTKYSQDALGDSNSIAEEALGSITTVRDFAAIGSEFESYSEELVEYYKLNMKQCYAYCGFALTWATIPNLVTALTLYYGGSLILANKLTSGNLVGFLLYQQGLTRAFSSIGVIFTGVAGALGAADKVFELMNRKPKITPCGNVVLPDDEFEGTLALENVVFRYPARPGVTVLKDFTLNVPVGKVVALVGPSGGGKSSCMRLFQHYYEPDTGNVTISGRPVHEFEQSWLKKHVAIVGQEPVLFGRSIKRNIMYGLEGTEMEPTMDKIIEAAKLSNAHNFIMDMPKGYDTEVGERGVQLSGGQKQRIALARSLVRSPSVLFLDEATSALDTESEAVVQAALDKIMRNRGRTVLVIAHRLSTVRDADIIVVINDGKVAEQGTHDELVANKGVYANLIHRQLQGIASENEGAEATEVGESTTDVE